MNSRQVTHRLFDCEEPVAHPSAGCPVPTDVGEPAFVVPVRRAKRHLLDRLVDHESTSLVVNNAKAVAAHVKNSAHTLTLRSLQREKKQLKQV